MIGVMGAYYDRFNCAVLIGVMSANYDRSSCAVLIGVMGVYYDRFNCAVLIGVMSTIDTENTNKPLSGLVLLQGKSTES